jgi:nicotinate-nucleotide pyrophosphorylase (carboxylating)
LIDSKKTKILDTRKTTPNFRIIEKMAVKIGGGHNHRWGLYDEILVKDNHIEANGNLKKTLEKLKVGLSKIKSKYKIIVEVESLSEFKVAVQYPFIDRILLDNMSPNQIKKIVKINNGTVKQF